MHRCLAWSGTIKGHKLMEYIQNHICCTCKTLTCSPEACSASELAEICETSKASCSHRLISSWPEGPIYILSSVTRTPPARQKQSWHSSRTCSKVTTLPLHISQHLRAFVCSGCIHTYNFEWQFARVCNPCEAIAVRSDSELDVSENPEGASQGLIF